MRILLVEDETAISAHVAGTLRMAGFEVATCDNGPEAWDLGGTEDFDAIVLDLGLPGLDGLTLLKRWRAEGIDTPVLVLTARGSWMERVDGFDAGADDYLPKPFRTEELMARLRALLRRAGRLSAPARQAGRLSIDGRTMQVSVDGQPVTLSPAEYRAVEKLAAEAGKAVSVGELSEAIHGRDDGSRNAIEVLINRLRRKLGPDIIMTRRGFGYYLSDGQE